MRSDEANSPVSTRFGSGRDAPGPRRSPASWRAHAARAAIAALTAAATLTACGSGDDAPAPDAGGPDAALGDDAGTPPGDGGLPTRIGGDRPARVILPDDYDGTPRPLLFVLHGRGANGRVQDAYFGASAYARTRGVITVVPEGQQLRDGTPVWNATDACCGGRLDDSAYLAGLIDEASVTYAVDPARVYFMGHSNGGFMSYRMACDHAGRVAAIASLAGATWNDERNCPASEPVSVLQIHGTSDDLVPYATTPYLPGARDSVERWASRAGCDLGAPDAGDPLDLDSSVAGAESTVLRWRAGCAPGFSGELWSIVGGGHIPPPAPGFGARIIDWLLTQRKGAPPAGP
jgi:polyhydroxybutyrate depolymerase